MNAARGPLICICVPTYNSAATLSGTLDSILAQTYDNISIFVVDNASTDNSAAIADGYAVLDSRVRVLRHSENVGAEGNFTRCLQLASGDYTAIYHSDDIYSPYMVEEQVSFLEQNPAAGAVLTMAIAIDASGAEGRVYRLPKELHRGADGLYDFAAIFRSMLRNGNFLFCPSAMVRTPVYRDHIKKWDPGNFHTAADGDVWLRILQKYPIGIIDKPLLKYRISVSSFSYHAARGKTEPHDMVRLFDAYMKGPARGIIGDKERKDFALLVMKDNINRSFNLLLSDKRNEALSLLKSSLTPGIISYAFTSLIHVRVMVYGFFVFLITLIPLNAVFRKLLFKVRF